MSIISNTGGPNTSPNKILLSEENDNVLNYKLENINGASLSDILQILKSGGRFIIFYYRVSIIAVSFQRLSPAILIRNDDEFQLYRKKYNKKAFILGFLFFPLGPLLSLKEYKLNNKGGLNVTGDILLNLTEMGLKNNEVVMKEMYTIFGNVGKSEMKYFEKILYQYGKETSIVLEIYVATFINVEEYEEPPYCIGVALSDSSRIDEESINKLLYKQFRSFVQFEYFDLNNTDDGGEIPKRFRIQGKLIYKR